MREGGKTPHLFLPKGCTASSGKRHGFVARCGERASRCPQGKSQATASNRLPRGGWIPMELPAAGTLSTAQPEMWPKQRRGQVGREWRWAIRRKTKGTAARCGNLGGIYVPPSSSRNRASLCGSTTPTSVFAWLINCVFFKTTQQGSGITWD